MKATKGTRVHIGFFGRRNAGKSSIVNKIIGQELSIVSDIAGTTTDVNLKSMELLPVGPVVLMDTAGFDDIGELGRFRVEKTLKALERTDVAVVVFDYNVPNEDDFLFLNRIKEKGIPLISILNKTDTALMPDDFVKKIEDFSDCVIKTSVLTDDSVRMKFKEALIKVLPEEFIKETSIVGDIVQKSECAVLVVPIDKEAPKGRLILPQVNIIRDLLDIGACCVVTRETELQETLAKLKVPPKIVITDSQAFKKVSAIVHDNVMMTSFSILFARLKGDLGTFIAGAARLDSLKDNDKVLILESCSHHPVEDDIGRVKIPALIEKYTGKKLTYEHKSGHDFPDNVEEYALIVHCGACMTNRREMLSRINLANKNGIPITNYGIAIAKCLGILDRAVKPLLKE